MDYTVVVFYKFKTFIGVKSTKGFGVSIERPGEPCLKSNQRDSELPTPKLFATFWLQKVGPSGSVIKKALHIIFQLKRINNA